MDRIARLLVENWTVDYGEGHVETVCVPHAWRQDVPVSFEGPVVYRTDLEIPRKPSTLRFHGVSYAAEVSINGEVLATHCGIWDAFDVPLSGYKGHRVKLEVKVTKNGGPTYPVKDVASGFLPFVFHPFGGIHGDVEIIENPAPAPGPEAATPRIRVEGRRIFVEGRPFYPRGLLHWGWYPELGHTNPSDETIRAEVRSAKRLGFNLVKFCLWVPSHRHLDILREEGIEAWIELPLWDPSGDPSRLAEIAEELERIVRQYRHHEVLCWTVGCELSGATPPAFRQRMVQLIKNLTGSPLVKDNSGGAEMYGGDLREFGDFDDFHPYCEVPFYPAVLDSLLPAPRPDRPVLLGEFNDIDAHRDLARIADELPFWASQMLELNAQGARWQHDLPGVVAANRFAQEPGKNRHHALMESSRRKALFIRKFVHEAVRAREALSGYVVTGIRDTPISSAGFFDDWGEARFRSEECRAWNAPDVLYMIPTRRPPWINGGNRPGWTDPFNYFAGQVFIRVGLHSESGLRSGLIWSVRDLDGRIAAEGAEDWADVPALASREVANISGQCEAPGTYLLAVEFGGTTNEWPIHVFEPLTVTERKDWEGLEAGGSAGEVRFLDSEGTIPMPFWREAAIEFLGDPWGIADCWERLLSISPDRAIDSGTLPEHEVLINRIDTRTYAEHPIAVRTANGILTTLRPFGGLGIQPTGVIRNPSGADLLRRMLSG